jgi:hypothetical protein
MMNRCEACKKNEIEVIEPCDNENQPYQVCSVCHDRLMKYALRPIEWYNLAVIHTPHAYLLCDDLYEDDGEACQPEEEVVITSSDRAPTLEEVQTNIEELLDFSITKWFLEKEVITAFKEHDKETVLSSIKTRFYTTENYEIKSCMLEITADVLGTFASEWVRELWRQYDEILLVDLSDAAAASLPCEEGLKNVFEKLALVSKKELPQYASSCLHRFRASEILDW